MQDERKRSMLCQWDSLDINVSATSGLSTSDYFASRPDTGVGGEAPCYVIVGADSRLRLFLIVALASLRR